MTYKIKYIGKYGEIDFSQFPYICNTHDFFNYDLEVYATKLKSVNCYVVDDIVNPNINFILEVQVLGNKKEKHLVNMENIFGADRDELTPGRLFVDDEYIECFIVASVKKDFNKFKMMEYVTLSIYPTKAEWINEEKYTLSKYEDITSTNGFSFPLSFPSTFKMNQKSMTIFNNNYKSTMIKIIIYGEIDHPIITIGNFPYGIHAKLLVNERIEIEPRNKSIVKVTESGEVLNMFNHRDKDFSVFTKLQPGNNEVYLNGDYSIEVILLHERMEPRWKTD